MLRFIPETHTYLWNDKVVPSCTQVLREWIKVNFGWGYYVHTGSGVTVDVATFEAAQDFGSAVHEAAKYILTTGLDWDALDPSLVPPLKEFMRWVDDYKVKPSYVEQPMYSEKYGVAGTPDLIGRVQGFSQLDITDIKTGVINKMTGPQTGGYEIIFRDQEKYRGGIARHELILPRDGSPYKYNLLPNGNDNAFFLSRLFQYQYHLNAK